MDWDVAKKSLQFHLIKDIFKLLAGASSCKEIHDMQVELIFDIIFIVHQIWRLPAYSLGPPRHRIYPNFQTTFHMRRKSSFKPLFISVECIAVLREEVKKYLLNSDTCLIPGRITEHCSYEGCCLYSADIDVWRINFPFANFWIITIIIIIIIIIIIVNKYLSHYHCHCSFENYF